MDIGNTLRTARMRKNRTLEEVARATRIPLSTLAAMEGNEFARLPAAIYTRSFLRQYARQVDLDPEELVDHYLEEYAPATPAATEDERHAPRYDVVDGPAPRHVRTIVIPRPTSGPALGAVILVLGFIVYVFFTARAENTPVNVPTETMAAEEPQPAPVPDAARAVNVTPEALRVELKVNGPCWVSATADRAPALARLLQAGDNHALEARDELVLRVGDPGTLSVTINGQPTRPLGLPGQAVTILINKQNFRELLAS